MSRTWKETIPPKCVNDFMDVYHGWMKDMDRCWDSDDGYRFVADCL